jgi:Helicase conserved C-terminal domain
VQGSGKLHMLQSLLDVLLGMNKRVIIAAHESMAVLCDYLALRYGECAFHRICEETMARERDRALADFNSPAKPQDILVLEVSACSLGTDLRAADAAIIYDSDGHPASDIQRFGHARSLGNASKLLVFRLYSSGTLEEVIVAVCCLLTAGAMSTLRTTASTLRRKSTAVAPAGPGAHTCGVSRAAQAHKRSPRRCGLRRTGCRRRMRGCWRSRCALARRGCLPRISTLQNEPARSAGPRRRQLPRRHSRLTATAPQPRPSATATVPSRRRALPAATHRA